MKQICNIREYHSLVEKYKQKGCLSNDYIQQEAVDLIIHNKLFAEYYEKNAFLFVKQNYGMRVYYYINDLKEFVDFTTYHNLNVEILFRKELPQNEVNYFLAIGFNLNLQRDLYCGIRKDFVIEDITNTVKIKVADTLDDVIKCVTLFNKVFDTLSGDYIKEEECKDILQKKQLLVAKTIDGDILGAFHYSIERGVVWGHHLAVFPEARGQSVGILLLYSLIKETTIDDNTRYMWWVQHQNEAAIKLYKKAGLRYINKSTISLIKL